MKLFRILLSLTLMLGLFIEVKSIDEKPNEEATSGSTPQEHGNTIFDITKSYFEQLILFFFSESRPNSGNAASDISSSIEAAEAQVCQLQGSPFINSHMVKDTNFTDFCPNEPTAPSHYSNQHREFECVKTATNGYVYMKTCSSTWTDSTIREYCEATNLANSSLWLTVPVTKNGTTFKNIFCLICQNEKPTNWSFWELGFSCFNQSTGLPAKILEGSANISALKPYDAGFWTYTAAEKKYTCFLHPEVPTNSNYSRCCKVPNTEKTQNTCFSDHLHVYADCVFQFIHNVSKHYSCNPTPKEMNMIFKVKLTKEMIPLFPHCDRILKNTTLYNITCLPTPSSNWTSPRCPLNKFVNVDSSDISKYSNFDWWYVNKTTIYICKELEYKSESCQLSLPFNSPMLTTNKNENFNDFCPNVTTAPSNYTNQHEFECVKTATNGYVHMKTCSSNWNDSTIRGYCQVTNPVNSSLWLTVPVTQNGTTFKNIFCLICQNEKPTNWSFWELGFSCFNQSTGLAAKILEGSANISALKPYDAGFWTYTEAEKKYTCSIHPEVPTNSNYSRCCKASIQNTCWRNHSHVNANCVIQLNHSISKNDSCNPSPTEVNMTFKVKLTKEMIPPFPHCDRILKNTTLYNITCPPTTSSNWTSTECQFNKFFTNDSDISKYLQDDQLYINPTSIYICQGHLNPLPLPSTSWIETLAFISLIVSFGGLILYLLIFSLLPEKNLWDKCLAVFCTMLLIQVLSVIAEKPHSLVSHVWHYTLLGCLTWILILCCDYKTSIYKTSGVNLSPDRYANQKFKRYWITSCVLPLVLLILAYFWTASDFAEATVHDHLLRGSPVGYYWCIAFLLSVVSCSYLGRICYLVFIDTQLSYTIRSFNMPGKVIVAMVVIWMVGSLAMLAEFTMSNATFYIWHLLQAASFLIFSYKQAVSRIKRELGMNDSSARNEGQAFMRF